MIFFVCIYKGLDVLLKVYRLISFIGVLTSDGIVIW